VCMAGSGSEPPSRVAVCCVVENGVTRFDGDGDASRREKPTHSHRLHRLHTGFSGTWIGIEVHYRLFRNRTRGPGQAASSSASAAQPQAPPSASHKPSRRNAEMLRAWPAGLPRSPGTHNTNRPALSRTTLQREHKSKSSLKFAALCPLAQFPIAECPTWTCNNHSAAASHAAASCADHAACHAQSECTTMNE